MKKSRFPTTLLFVAFVLCSAIILGQNSYQFIEPNISFAYDSNLFKITNRYSNTTYETESYDFELKNDTLHKVRIHVSAKHPPENAMSITELETKMQSRIASLEQANNNMITIVEYDKKVRHIGEFLCFGMIILDKKSNKTGATIICNHISSADLTEIQLTSLERQSLSEDYRLLEQLLNGFRCYSKKEISKEEVLIKATYSINVDIAKDTMEHLRWRSGAYFAIVKTKEKLQHQVKEVRLDNKYGQELFTANEKGEVYIACSDKEKGIIERKGVFVIINSFGKQVKIPFTFKYKRT